MEIYETVQLKYFFEYLKNNNIYKLNEKEKINAIASDLLSKTPSLKYIVKQCIDNEIFLSLYNIDALDESKQRELLNRNFQKMCNLMSIKEDIAIEIIAVFLDSNGVLIDKDLLKLNVHENNYGWKDSSLGRWGKYPSHSCSVLPCDVQHDNHGLSIVQTFVLLPRWDCQYEDGQ